MSEEQWPVRWSGTRAGATMLQHRVVAEAVGHVEERVGDEQRGRQHLRDGDAGEHARRARHRGLVARRKSAEDVGADAREEESAREVLAQCARRRHKREEREHEVHCGDRHKKRRQHRPDEKKCRRALAPQRCWRRGWRGSGAAARQLHSDVRAAARQRGGERDAWHGRHGRRRGGRAVGALHATIPAVAVLIAAKRRGHGNKRRVRRIWGVRRRRPLATPLSSAAGVAALAACRPFQVGRLGGVRGGLLNFVTRHEAAPAAAL
eukprot:354071-Chlamydomonas_euryale.AAC.2